MRSLMETLHAAWRARDLDAALETMAETVVHSINMDRSDPPYVATCVGKAEVRERLQLVLDTFIFERWERLSGSADKDTGRAMVAAVVRHPASGTVLDSRFRFFYRARGGKFVLIEETLDFDQVERFLKLVQDGT